MNPYDMNRVSLSKSKGGGDFLLGAKKSEAYALFSLYSDISIPSDMSCPRLSFRFDLERIAVKVCATESAMPPRTCLVISL